MKKYATKSSHEGEQQQYTQYTFLLYSSRAHTFPDVYFYINNRCPSILQLDNVYFRFHRWTDESIIHAQLRLIFVSKHICISLLWKHAYMLSSAIIKMFLNFDVSCILHKLVVVVLLRAIFKMQLRNFGISVDYPCNWVVINVWRCVTLLRQVQP